MADQDAYDRQLALYFGPFVGSLGLDLIAAAYPPEDYDGSYRDALVAAFSDVQFGCPGREAALEIAAAQTEFVHQYRFGDVPDNAPALLRARGATHGLDVVYTFGTLADAGYALTDGDRAAVQAMQRAWVTLAQGEAPGFGPPFDGWFDVESDGEPTLLIESGSAVVDSPLAERCAFWTSLVGG